MSDLSHTLNRLAKTANGQDLLDRLRCAAFGAVRQIHREVRQLPFNASTLKQHLDLLEILVAEAKKTESLLNDELKGSMSQIAIAITEACIK